MIFTPDEQPELPVPSMEQVAQMHRLQNKARISRQDELLQKQREAVYGDDLKRRDYR